MSDAGLTCRLSFPNWRVGARDQCRAEIQFLNLPGRGRPITVHSNKTRQTFTSAFFPLPFLTLPPDPKLPF